MQGSDRPEFEFSHDFLGSLSSLRSIKYEFLCRKIRHGYLRQRRHIREEASTKEWNTVHQMRTFQLNGARVRMA
jgi:hypothetical protein